MDEEQYPRKKKPTTTYRKLLKGELRKNILREWIDVKKAKTI